jgi:hypothetical protein
MSRIRSFFPILFLVFGLLPSSWAAENVIITDVPDYNWYAGCFGAASGNLMGYWDRHGMQNFYTGPANGGVAPLDSFGSHVGIRSLWASKAGFDGRPADKPGHIDDYWEFFFDENRYSYESTATDPYVIAGRPEHAPDCTGDFMGSSQNKWSDLDGECSGNIDAFSFNFWDKTGGKRINFAPPALNGLPVRDIQSGFRAWCQSRGYDSDVFSQMVDFNPTIPSGTGFTFADLKAEIDSGYPVMLFLQNPSPLSRNLPGMPRANPEVHGMLAYGYFVVDSGEQWVRYRTSWGSGDNSFALWGPQVWEAEMTLRGVVGFHPLPKITQIKQEEGKLTIGWDGPSSIVKDYVAGTTSAVHWYVIEKCDSLSPAAFAPISEPVSDLQTTIDNCCEAKAFFRVKLLEPQQARQANTR